MPLQTHRMTKPGPRADPLLRQSARGTRDPISDTQRLGGATHPLDGIVSSGWAVSKCWGPFRRAPGFPALDRFRRGNRLGIDRLAESCKKSHDARLFVPPTWSALGPHAAPSECDSPSTPTIRVRPAIPSVRCPRGRNPPRRRNHRGTEPHRAGRRPRGGCSHRLGRHRRAAATGLSPRQRSDPWARRPRLPEVSGALDAPPEEAGREGGRRPELPVGEGAEEDRRPPHLRLERRIHPREEPGAPPALHGPWRRTRGPPRRRGQ